MAHEDKFFDQLTTLLPRRIYFLLWLAEFYLAMLAAYIPDYLEKSFSRKAGGITFQAVIAVLLISAFSLWKTTTPSGRKWLWAVPSSTRRSPAPNRAFQIFFWVLPTFGIIGMIGSAIYFQQ